MARIIQVVQGGAMEFKLLCSYKMEYQEIIGRLEVFLEGLWASLTSCFAPFGRSGHVIHDCKKSDGRTDGRTDKGFLGVGWYMVEKVSARRHAQQREFKHYGPRRWHIREALQGGRGHSVKRRFRWF